MNFVQKVKKTTQFRLIVFPKIALEINSRNDGLQIFCTGLFDKKRYRQR